MSKPDLLCCLLGTKLPQLSQEERVIWEVRLFVSIYHELSDIFKSRYKECQRLIKYYPDQEENMCRIKFMQEMIKDILSTEEYSLTGIAIHTNIPEDVLSDIVAGVNTNPTFELSCRLFELHISVRRDLYNAIMQKIALMYLSS